MTFHNCDCGELYVVLSNVSGPFVLGLLFIPIDCVKLLDLS